MQLVTIYTALNPADAQLVRSRLEVAEFHPFVKNEGAALAMEGYAVTVGGIQVQVPDSEAEEALAFINTSVDVPE